MNRLVAKAVTCGLIGLLCITAMAQNASGRLWIGTWATAPQPSSPGHLQSIRNQTLRLIVHTSAGGTKVRIKISNTFGDHALRIGSAHIARRTDAADIDPTSDRTLTFHGQSSTTVAAGSMVVSDAVGLEVPALVGSGDQPVSSRDHRGDDLARSGDADELHFRRDRGLYG